ncbi:hypothetical protein [Paenibacillus sp. SN-8-1]|uniref:hypothetical protein n=1 Tax=Paenibacillus sp. SN-8-1 TaxID=3435409 RepID=UPI003D9A4637
MKRQHALSVELKSGEIAIVDKGRKSFQIYNRGEQAPAAKLKSLFDIITLRDLLNDAYPVEDYSHAQVRVQKSSSL